jgi:hypothetical protein
MLGLKIPTYLPYRNHIYVLGLVQGQSRFMELILQIPSKS